MSRDVHVRFCEQLGGELPGLTRLSIYCRSHSEARKVGNATYLFLKNKLRLPINRDKSGIRKPLNFNILGYGFVSAYEKGKKGVYQLVVAAKSWKNLKASLKEVTRKTKPYSFDERMKKLKEIFKGWLQYFRMANITGKLKTLDGWLRNRIRYCIWHHWYRACEITTEGSNKRERKRKNLLRLGVNKSDAYSWSRTRMGGWAVAQSPIMGTTITIERLKKRGYESLSDYFSKISPS